jgi:membrane peptidoglycan carboxypeptidase
MYGEQVVEKGGLKVYTTLDWDKQQIAEQAVKAGAEKNATAYGANNAALVAEDPKTGQVLAMVGSKDYFAKSSPAGCVTGKNCKFEGNFNVTTAGRQPGSSFKPYVYLTAFEKGYTPETMFWDVDTNFDTGKEKDYNPKNYDGKNRGPLQMKNALAMSLNVPAVETLYLAGVKESIDTARKMGITTLTEPDRYGLSLVLGGGEVKLIDHVNAFGTLANNGVFLKKTAILKIQDSAGNVLEEYKNPGGERVVEEKYIGMLDYIMSTNDLRAPVFGDNNPLKFTDRPVAAKTGTTNEWRDGWTVGYTPSLAVGVWAGNNDNSPMAQGADGVYVAAPIWRAFMDQALKNYAVEQFPKYEKEETGKPVLDGTLDITNELRVCLLPGKKDKYCLATDACPDNTDKKKKFVSAHSILYYIKKDDPRGDQPKNPEDDPQYKNWEKAVQEWVSDHGKEMKGEPAPEKECKSSDFQNSGPSVNIKSPSDGDTIHSASFTISASASAGYGIKRLSLSVNGSEVSSKDSSGISYTYKAPVVPVDSDLKIEAKAVDDNGDSDSSSIKIHIVVP